MKSINEIDKKIEEINDEIRIRKIEIDDCIKYQKDKGERLNKNCDYIMDREYRISVLAAQKFILGWVKS